MRAKKINELNLGFNIGDEVEINNDYVYYNYTPFIKRHRKYAIYWQYKSFIRSTEILTVIGVYKHVQNNSEDKCKYCIVVQDTCKRIYLVGELGVKLLCKSADSSIRAI